MENFLKQYQYQSNIWDEMRGESTIREHYSKLFDTLRQMNIGTLHEKDKQASELFLNQGITFTVYSDNEGIERIFPYDIIPRIITSAEWTHIEEGIKQRLKALNLFLKDIYNEQRILKDKVIPSELISSCPHYTRQVHGIKVPHDIYVHISGIDLIRAADGKFYILEDNLRTPSGVSYMMKNREITKRIFPDIFYENKVRTVGNYPLLLHEILSSLSPKQISHPTVALLTPGVYNSAYYEHSFLARQMGIPLVEGRDLIVNNHKVYMKTTNGYEQVHVLYRRIDDEFLDQIGRAHV